MYVSLVPWLTYLKRCGGGCAHPPRVASPRLRSGFGAALRPRGVGREDLEEVLALVQTGRPSEQREVVLHAAEARGEGIEREPGDDRHGQRQQGCDQVAGLEELPDAEIAGVADHDEFGE